MNRFDLSNRTAIVTGGAQGLGFGIAKRFIESGAEVIIWDIDKELLKSAEKKLNSNKAIFQSVNVANFEDVKKNIDQITAEKKIDILINNAGVTGLTAKLWDYPIDEWHKVLNVNLNGTFYCCKVIVPHMIKNNYGRIVNVASVAGKDGNANASAYSSAKAAAIGFTKSLGKELAEKNIAVNAVTPASAKTRILDQMSKEHVQFMFSKIPRKRFLEMDEFASLVTWLSSQENSFSTGAVFDISGGRSTY